MGKKILLADDSITIQKVIELTFSDEDFEVVTVGNGRLAIERVQDVRPDLVLCDIIMPEKDGYEVCDFIKKHPSLSHVPVLLLTGAFEPFDQDRATRVGCDGFLAKPFEPQTLIAKVKDLLSRATTPTVAAPAAPIADTPPPAAAPFVPASHLEEERPPWAPAPPPPPPVVEAPASPSWGEPAEPAAAAPPEDAATPTWTPTAATASPAWGAPAEAASEPSFFTEEALEQEPAPALPSGPEPPAPAAAEEDFAGLGLEDFSVEYGAPSPAPAPPASTTFEAELYPLEDAGRDELLPVSAEEAASLQGPAEVSPERTGAWAQPTVEVPLEERARASVDARMESEVLFEEVFDEPAPATEPEAPAVLSAYAPAEPEPDVTPPAVARAPVETFADLAVEEAADEPRPESRAAQVGVQADVVSQIAQSVVAQISEKVIREIAWEVIPDLAETLIKKEIERLKADLG